MYSEEELLKDDLFLDIDASINQCKEANTDINTQNINYPKYYPCNLEKISKLKEKYTYLN